MFLLCLTLLFLCVYSSSQASLMCYGGTYKLDLGFYGKDFRGSVFFTPNYGGVKRLLMENGKPMEPRFKTISGGKLLIPGLTEQDAGKYSVISDSGGRPERYTTLIISECADTETKRYGGIFSLNVPRGAEFLEFTPSEKLEQVTVVWNRTDPNGGRGSVTRSYWEITGVTQEDSGFYKFRGTHNRLLTWRKLSVSENEDMHYLQEGESVRLECPAAMWTVTFEPRLDYSAPAIRLQRGDTGPFGDRLRFFNHVIIIDRVKPQDSGVFKFRDKNGNLVQRVDVDVAMYETPMWVYAAVVAGAIIGVIFCCCCFKKCCCKKSSSKRNNPQSAAARNVMLISHHDLSPPTQPQYSTTSPGAYSYQPVYREPASASGGPLAAAPGGQGATPPPSHSSAIISSNSDPQFELKGVYFSSASPLSSDTVITDVYSSDKLNFL